MDPVTASADLVHDAQTGDHRSFTTLIRSCDARMRRLAFRLLGSQAAMDDALQDAYLKAYRKLPTFRAESAFSTWLYVIVYRTCLDHRRTRERRCEIALERVDPIVVGGGADPAIRAGEVDALADALAELPSDQVAAVLLVDGDGLTYAEAARVLAVAEGTVASRLSRAHTALRAVLRGGTSA